MASLLIKSIVAILKNILGQNYETMRELRSYLSDNGYRGN